MAASAAGKFVSALCTLRSTTGRLNLGSVQSCTLLQARNYAARKGYRQMAKKKKVKVEVVKLGFIPHKQRVFKNAIIPVEKLRPDDTLRPEIPDDDVWIGKYHKWKIYSLEEAVQFAKETNCPELLDAPKAFMTAVIELDMTGPKPSRPVTQFARICPAPHRFDHGEDRTVAAFCKTPEMQEEAKKAGATIVGGQDLVARIQTGGVSVAEIDYAVAHPDMMAELLLIKGLLKRKYPTPGQGSLGANIPAMVTKFLYGIKYSGHPHDRQPLYGLAEASFGRIDMETSKLEDNLAAVIDDIMAHRPKRPGPFITRIKLMTLPSAEHFTIDHELYVKEDKENDDDDDDDDEEEGVDKKTVEATS